jgi:hypothetical protein
VDNGQEQIDALQKPELERLATEINQEHAAFESVLRAGMAHALRCGDLLMAAKKLVAHGGWLPWLAANCTVSERTAQAYIRVARHRAELEEKSATGVADLSFREGLRLLAEPTQADESWQDEAKPDSKYIPPEGFILRGWHNRTEITIAPYQQQPGYCFVMRLDDHDPPDGGGIVEGTKRPVRNNYIEATLRILKVDVDSFQWEEIPSAPWPSSIYFDDQLVEAP